MMFSKLFCCGVLPVGLLVGAMAYFTTAGANDSTAPAAKAACSCCVDCSNPNCPCELLNCRCDQGEACKCDTTVSTVASTQKCDCCDNCTNENCICEEVGCQCDAGGPCACAGSCCEAVKAVSKAAGSCCEKAGCCSK